MMIMMIAVDRRLTGERDIRYNGVDHDDSC